MCYTSNMLILQLIRGFIWKNKRQFSYFTIILLIDRFSGNVTVYGIGNNLTMWALKIKRLIDGLSC